MKKIYLSLLALIFALQLSAQTTDVCLIDIILPTQYVNFNSSIAVKIRIKNCGNQTLTSIPLTYRRLTQNLFTEIWTGNLTAGDSTDFTFQTLLNIPMGSSFYFYTYAQLPEDSNQANDTLSRLIQICSVYPAAGITGQSNIIAYETPYTYTTPSIMNATSYEWEYLPSDSVSIINNGTSATITFHSGSISGFLSVNGKNSYCSGNKYYLYLGPYTYISESNKNEFNLLQNNPNPASTNTTIKYSIPTAGIIKFEVLNILGQTVFSKTEKQQAGENSINLNLKDFRNGIYYYAIEYKGKKQFKKMMVLK
jgi:hypothetical protein